MVDTDTHVIYFFHIFEFAGFVAVFIFHAHNFISKIFSSET